MILLNEGIDSQALINQRLQNGGESCIIKMLDGKYKSKKGSWTETPTITDYDTVYEAVLRVTTPKTDIAIKRALKAINKTIAEREIRIIGFVETSAFNEIPVISNLRRMLMGEELVRLTKLFRPQTITVGMAESFMGTKSEIQEYYRTDSDYKNMRKTKWNNYIPYRGTPVVRFGYGEKNTNKYSNNKEYLYIKL